MNSVSDWLLYLETLHYQAIELGLERVQVVGGKLDVLSFPCPVITVGGTNGKGSCVTFIASILKAAQYKVGVYTSPHLLNFNERISIQGTPVENSELIKAFQMVESIRGDITLTYFEFTTLAALWLFKTAKVDAIVLEVGLGGRLDAVNVVEPDMSVVTSIDLDHQNFLGDTREAIGYEKAGIFRSGKPALCGDPNPPISLLNQAYQINSILYCVGKAFSFTETSSKTWSWKSVHQQYENLPIPTLPIQNAATALMAIECLKKYLTIKEGAILRGIQTAFLPGRFQFFKVEQRDVWLDVAHNPAAASYLAHQIKIIPKIGLIRAVVSILSDKDILETLRPLLPVVDIWYVAGLETLPRGTTSNTLANCLQKLGVPTYHIHQEKEVLSAFNQAISDSKAQDKIIVFGSFHTVAPILEKLCNSPGSPTC